MRKILMFMGILALNFAHADLINDLGSSLRKGWSPVERKFALDKCFKQYEINPHYKDKSNLEIFKYEYKKESHKSYESEEFEIDLVLRKALTDDDKKRIAAKTYNVTPQECAKASNDVCYKLGKEEAKKLILDNPKEKRNLENQFDVFKTFFVPANASWEKSSVIKVLNQELIITNISFTKKALVTVSSIQVEIPKYQNGCMSIRTGLATVVRSDPCDEKQKVTEYIYATDYHYKVKYKVKSIVEAGGFPKEKKPDVLKKDICAKINECDLVSKDVFLKENNCESIDLKKISDKKRESKPTQSKLDSSIEKGKTSGR